MMITPPESPASDQYGLSNDFMMPQDSEIQDVADHPATNLPMKKPHTAPRRKKK